MTPKENEFLSQAKEIGTQIKEIAEKNSKVLLICHFDADGLAAGGIMGKALLRWGANIHIRVAKQLDYETIQTLESIDRDITVFSEIGSGYLHLVEEHLKGKVFILDHHPVVNISRKLVHLNPMEFEFNGGKEISGAGVNYFSVKEADPRNIDLAPLSVVGALGDLQDRNKKHELVSLNKLIVEEGVKTGNLKVEKDLLLFGRETRPIHKALAFTSPPFLPGLTGNEENCLRFLYSAGIPLKEREKWRTVATLTMQEKKLLISKIVEYLTSKGFQSNRAEELIGSVYTLIQEEKGSFLRDAREYSYVLNACGRLNKSGLGISLCLGSREETQKEVENLVKAYRVALAKNMEWVSQNPKKIKNLGSLYVVRGEGFIDDNLIGAIASIISTSNILSRDKPIIITSKSNDGFIKISARASKNLVGKGIKLGEILSSLSEKFSGLGGGHDVAAGAQIPKENIEKFLKELNTEVSESILS